MSETNKKEYHPECYEVFFDAQEHSGVFGEMFNIGDVLFYNEHVVLFLRDGKKRDDLVKIMDEYGIGEYYTKAVKPEHCVGLDTIMKVWYAEKYEAGLTAFVNSEFQKDLQRIQKKLNENVKKITERSDSNE